MFGLYRETPFFKETVLSKLRELRIEMIFIRFSSDYLLMNLEIFGNLL